MTETREEAIARLEASGDLVPDCAGCQIFYDSTDVHPGAVFAPRHKRSRHCESADLPHCTCPICWG